MLEETSGVATNCCTLPKEEENNTTLFVVFVACLEVKYIRVISLQRQNTMNRSKERRQERRKKTIRKEESRDHKGRKIYFKRFEKQWHYFIYSFCNASLWVTLRKEPQPLKRHNECGVDCTSWLASAGRDGKYINQVQLA